MPFAEVAISGEADALVTGNLKHFNGVEPHKINVISPAKLLDLLTE